MITRTITVTDLAVTVINRDTMEIDTRNAQVYTTFNETDFMKNYTKYLLKSEMIVKVEKLCERVIRVGMSEEDFVRNGEVL